MMKELIWRTARGIRSLGSFQGKMLTSAFGASIAHSMATAYGCAGTSSGRTRIGFWQLRTKSRVTVKTKSGLVSNILVTNWSVVCNVISGRLAMSVAPQPFQNVPAYFGSRISGRQPTGCASTAAAIRLGARFKRLQMKGPPLQKPITANLSCRDVHQPELIGGIGFPRPVDLDRTSRLSGAGVAQIRRDRAGTRPRQ